MKLKKLIVLTVTIAMLVSLLPGCGGKGSKNADNKTPVATDNTGKDDGALATDDYSEHQKISVLTFEGNDILDRPAVKEAMEKFNVEFEIVTVAYDAWDEKVRTMVAADSLPEFVAWYNFNYSEYANWAKQGIFKDIPDLSKYPNIKKELDGIIADDYMHIDGKLYCIPKTLNANPYNNLGQDSFYYRRDWAEKIGYDFKPAQEMSFEEFINYLKDVRDKEPSGLGKDKLGILDMESGYVELHGIIRSLWNPYVGMYVKKDGEYVWGTALSETLEALKDLQKMYKEGLIPPDFYTYKMNEGSNRFRAGRSAVLFSYLNPVGIQEYVDKMRQDIEGFKDDDFGIMVVKSTSGKVNSLPKLEYWAASAYSSKISDKKMDRMLKIHDWAISQEMIEYFAFGIPGEDWERQGDQITLKWPKDDKGTYALNTENGKDYITAQRAFQKWFKLEGDDLWIPGNPFYRKNIIKLYEDAQRLKEQVGVNLIENDWEVNFLSSTNKNKYGAFIDDAKDAFTRIIISSNDIEKDWNDWLKSMEPRVKLVLDEINANVK